MELNAHQKEALQAMQQFIQDPSMSFFVLRGYAGTGKTTLVKFLLNWIEQQEKMSYQLLASTGRAAKVLSNKADAEATTVHSHIYAFEVMEEEKVHTGTQLSLLFNLKESPKKANGRIVYVVDEASMLSDEVMGNNHVAKFGSGTVLKDLIEFVGNHQIIFVGDPLQLPPITNGVPFSPALSVPHLAKAYEKKATGYDLKVVVRQASDHPILDLATRIRSIMNNREDADWEAVVDVKAPNIYKLFTGQLMIDAYLKNVSQRWNQAIILTHSNKQAHYLNYTVRKTRFKGEPPHHLQVGELLMVTQNCNYLNLANGDMVLVRKAKPAGNHAGFFMVEVEIENVESGAVHETLLLHDFLFKEDANLDPEKQRRLMVDFDRRAKDKGMVRNSEPYNRAMMTDPYLNALRAKFGYAVTVHKAQGGEWPHVYINLSETLHYQNIETRFRWLYTAITRAQKTLSFKPIFKGISKKNTNQK